MALWCAALVLFITGVGGYFSRISLISGLAGEKGLAMDEVIKHITNKLTRLIQLVRC